METPMSYQELVELVEALTDDYHAALGEVMVVNRRLREAQEKIARLEDEVRGLADENHDYQIAVECFLNRIPDLLASDPRSN